MCRCLNWIDINKYFYAFSCIRLLTLSDVYDDILFWKFNSRFSRLVNLWKTFLYYNKLQLNTSRFLSQRFNVNPDGRFNPWRCHKQNSMHYNRSKPYGKTWNSLYNLSVFCLCWCGDFCRYKFATYLQSWFSLLMGISEVARFIVWLFKED